MSTKQEIPKGLIAIVMIFIIFFFINLIVNLAWLADNPNGEISLIYLILGIIFLIPIIIIPLYIYRKYKAGGFIKKTSQETTVSGEGELITDEEMRKAYKQSIAAFIIGWIMVAASAPFVMTAAMGGGLPMVIITFAVGFAAGLIGSFFIITYKTNPERMRKIITKRRKRKMKKKT